MAVDKTTRIVEVLRGVAAKLWIALRIILTPHNDGGRMDFRPIRACNDNTAGGRSMVEILGVLAIVGVLSLGGLTTFRLAIDESKANEIMHNALIAAYTINSMDIELIPKTPTEVSKLGMMEDKNMTYSSDTNSPYFYITISNLTKGVCKKLIELKPNYCTADLIAGSTINTCGSSENEVELTFSHPIHLMNEVVCPTDKPFKDPVSQACVGKDDSTVCGQNTDCFECYESNGFWMNETCKCPTNNELVSGKCQPCPKERPGWNGTACVCSEDQFYSTNLGCVNCNYTDSSLYPESTYSECSKCPRRTYDRKRKYCFSNEETCAQNQFKLVSGICVDCDQNPYANMWTKNQQECEVCPNRQWNKDTLICAPKEECGLLNGQQTFLTSSGCVSCLSSDTNALNATRENCEKCPNRVYVPNSFSPCFPLPVCSENQIPDKSSEKCYNSCEELPLSIKTTKAFCDKCPDRIYSEENAFCIKNRECDGFLTNSGCSSCSLSGAPFTAKEECDKCENRFYITKLGVCGNIGKNCPFGSFGILKEQCLSCDDESDYSVSALGVGQPTTAEECAKCSTRYYDSEDQMCRLRKNQS